MVRFRASTAGVTSRDMVSGIQDGVRRCIYRPDTNDGWVAMVSCLFSLRQGVIDSGWSIVNVPG